MHVVLGGIFGLWINVLARRYLRSAPTNKSKWKRLSNSYAGTAAQKDIMTSLEYLGISLPDTVPVVYIVGDRRARRTTKISRSQFWSSTVPAHALLEITPHIYVSSPEYCFVQLAKSLTVTELIELGFALCGSYFPAHCEAGFITFDQPLTTPEKLSAFVEECAGAHGVKKARRAVRHIISGARSPMECSVAMLFCLERRLGGYGLPKASLNYRVDLSAQARKMSQSKWCLVDICWPIKRIGLEYNGAAYHQQKTKDQARRLALHHMGWDIELAAFEQISNRYQREELIRTIARRLDHRLKGLKQEYIRRREELIAQLLPQRVLGNLLRDKATWTLSSTYFPLLEHKPLLSCVMIRACDNFAPILEPSVLLA